ncbi:hypothetical protein EZJ17_09385 [Eikenella exigua]|uniref:Neisseria meningitidis TspB protein n=1 Tax=Eikenella exigua TaxID=2528037 RepID=A0AAX1F9Z0_9NEIS|nr:hypothetical protein EZJ17_09385 [Eikenella exigua]
MLNVLSFVRIKNFIRNCLLFSCLLLPLCAFAGPEFIIDGKTGLPVRVRSGFNVNGLKPAYSTATRSFYYEYSVAHDLSTLRSVMTGARKTARVPATITRTVSRARVARGLLTKLRYAKFTPQSLVAGLLFEAILDKVLDAGYSYDADKNNMVMRNVTLFCAFSSGGCIDTKAKQYIPDNKFAVYGKPVENLSNDVIERELCRQVTKEHFNFSDQSAIGVKLSCGYQPASKQLLVQFEVVKQIGFLRPGQISKQYMQVSTLALGEVELTEEDLARIAEPIFEEKPEEVIKAAELPDSAWSEPKVSVLDGTIVNSDPFTDSRDGKAKQAQWRFYNCSAGTCVQETFKDRPDLKPNSPEAPAATPGGNQSGNGNKDQPDQQKPFDLCREHPEIMACDQQPEPGSADLTIPKETVNLDFKPENVFSTDAACPKGEEFEAFGGRFSISLEPACAAARKIRPFIIAGAWLVAAFFVVRVVRQEV